MIGKAVIDKAPAAMLAGMFVAAMAYTSLQIAQLPYAGSGEDLPAYRDVYPVRWRVHWVTVNVASFVSAMSFLIIVLGRLRQSKSS